MMAEVPANLGNTDWKIGVSNARGGALATFVLSTGPAAVVLSGIDVNVALGTGETLVTFPLGGAAGVAGAGFGTLKIDVPMIPVLSGFTFYSQWFVWDHVGPSGFATSRGGEVRLF
jgi:hypothetical protein